jgi:hypothetical protein
MFSLNNPRESGLSKKSALNQTDILLGAEQLRHDFMGEYGSHNIGIFAPNTRLAMFKHYQYRQPKIRSYVAILFRYQHSFDPSWINTGRGRCRNIDTRTDKRKWDLIGKFAFAKFFVFFDRTLR